MKNEKDLAQMGAATRAIHLGYDPASHQGALTPPVYMTSTYAFESAEQGAEIFEGQRPGYVYGRTKNPTQALLEQRVASLEGAEAGMAAASGMGAIAATQWTLVEPGAVVAVDHAIYGSAFSLFDKALRKFGVDVRFLDMTDHEAVAAVAEARPAVFYFETPSNPAVRVIDIAAVSAIARGVGALTVVDNTFATPILQRPIELGADLVVHSATKYLNGHGDVLAGIVVGDAERINQIRGFGLRFAAGATIAPHTAFLVLRGLKTLTLRMRAHSDSALEIARYLAERPEFAEVAYPLLDGFPQRALAERQMSGGGGIVSIRFKAGVAAGRAFIDRLQLIHCAVSLGDAETLIQHPASMTHAAYGPEARARGGITDDLFRISVGLEETDDLIYDIEQALSGG